MNRRTLVATRPSSQPARTIASSLAFIASEQARIADQRRVQVERRITTDQAAHVEDDLAVERENGREVPLSRAAYEALFDPHCLYR